MTTGVTVISVAELAKRWACKRTTILDAIRRGQIAAFKLGKRHWRIALTEVERIEREEGGRLGPERGRVVTS